MTRTIAHCLFVSILVLAGCVQDGLADTPTYETPDVDVTASSLSGPHRYIVTGQPGTSLGQLRARAAAEHGEVTHDLDLINAVAVTLPDHSAAVRMASSAGVLRVEEDAVAFASARPGGGSTPPPPQVTPWGVTAIGAVGTGYTGAGVDVAVVDTGIDPLHKDLAVVDGRNFSRTKGGDPTAWKDDNGHGTHVAGTVAALNNAYGVVGVAPGARLHAVKVLDRNGSGYYSDIIAGIQYAVAQGYDVINMSLGGSADVQALHDACDAAEAAGILVFAAAGNSGDENPATNDVGYPAAYTSVIAVAAVDSSLDVAYFSSDGPAVELAAPGVNVLSTIKGGGYQGGWNGTSMATPHAAGTGALLKQAYPGLSGACLRSHLQSSAVDLGDLGRDVFTGYGFVDVPGALASAAAGCP